MFVKEIWVKENQVIYIISSNFVELSVGVYLSQSMQLLEETNFMPKSKILNPIYIQNQFQNMAAQRNQMQIVDDKIDLKIGHSDIHKVVIDFHIN